MNAALQLDHLVIGARSLDEGVAWCEATLGVSPGPGGRHVLMSTHNRLIVLSSAAHPRSYLEVIAIDPDAPPPGRARWFDLDDGDVAQALSHGPQLLHWVARVSPARGIARVLADWQALGLDAGEVLQASRATPQGELRWQIAVRADGQRLLGGALPLLIEWGAVHPTDAMPASELSLRSFELGGPQALQAGQALEGQFLPPGRRDFSSAEVPVLNAVLQTPRGAVTLHSASPSRPV